MFADLRPGSVCYVLEKILQHRDPSRCMRPALIVWARRRLAPYRAPWWHHWHQALGTRPAPQQTPPLEEKLIDTSVQTLLPLLRSQPPFYSTIHIHGKPYLVTEGDTIRLPFLMPGVEPGDVLRLNRVTAIGSRDYTLKAATKEMRREKQSYLDESLFTIREGGYDL